MTYNFKLFGSLYFGFLAYSLVWQMSVITWNIYIPGLKSVFCSASLCSLESIWVLPMDFQDKAYVTAYLVWWIPGFSLQTATQLSIKYSLDRYLTLYHNRYCVILGTSHGLWTTLRDVGNSEVEIRTTSVLNMTLYPAPGIGCGYKERDCGTHNRQ